MTRIYGVLDTASYRQSVSCKVVFIDDAQLFGLSTSFEWSCDCSSQVRQRAGRGSAVMMLINTADWVSTIGISLYGTIASDQEVTR